jgi:hypothetical protein
VFKLKPAPIFEDTVVITDLDGSEQKLTLVFKHCAQSDMEKKVFDNPPPEPCDFALRFIDHVPEHEKEEQQSDRDFLKTLFDERKFSFSQILQQWVTLLGNGRRKN